MIHRGRSLAVLAVVVLGTMSLSASRVVAKGYRGGGGGGGGMRSGGGYNSGPSAAQQQQYAANRARQQQINEAQTQLNDAQQKLDEVITKYRVDYEKTPEWTQAQEDLAKAQTAYDDAKKPVLETVHKQQDYQDAIATKQKLAAELDAARNADGPVDAQKMTDLATQQMAAGATASRLEAAALDADSNVKDAKAKLLAANTVVQALHQKFLDSLKGNADYASAKAAVEDAHTKLVAARGGTPAANPTAGAKAAPAGSTATPAAPSGAETTGSKTGNGGDN